MQVLTLKDYQIVSGGQDVWLVLRNILQNKNPYSNILVLVDANTRIHCLPVLESELQGIPFQVIEVPAGENYKQISTCEGIWNAMLDYRIDRKALMINLGGGVVGDMGGFCAATFKRGIDFIQLPTTLLSMVDASVGGKLGVDFVPNSGPAIKNCIGLFRNPVAVLVFPEFLHTLPFKELRSGFAEIIKHALIADVKIWDQLIMINDLKEVNWESLIPASVAIKKKVVEEDPLEKGLRKVLNFGHTIGHALESYSLTTSRPLLHGEAIAIGMVCEAWLSSKEFVLKFSDLKIISDFIIHHYGKYNFPEQSFNALLKLMEQDKKNFGSAINFTLLKAPGQAVVDQTCDPEAIVASLRYYLQL